MEAKFLREAFWNLYLKSSGTLSFLSFFYFKERENEWAGGGEGQKERQERASQAGCMPSMKPNTGLSLSPELMTWAEINSQRLNQLSPIFF